MSRNRLRVLCVVGTRPEAIKMSPLINTLQLNDRIHCRVCLTGQHRDMVTAILNLFKIKPEFDLRVMAHDQELCSLTSLLLSGLNGVIKQVQPDWILAEGDTTTVLAASVSAYYNRIRFGHVEAGLRSGDLLKPFPEEGNRIVADSLADLLFAPTERNRNNLLQAGIPDERIVVTGNTVIDALLQVSKQQYHGSKTSLAGLPLDKEFLLVTVHRRESFGSRLREILLAIRDVAGKFEAEGLQLIYPVHLNPNVRIVVHNTLSGVPNVWLIEPVDYASMIHLMKRARLVLTDSGGIQEEAPSLGVPVLVLRDETERPEGIESGGVRLIGTERNHIVREITRMLRQPNEFGAPDFRVNPYGDGNASERIMTALLNR